MAGDLETLLSDGLIDEVLGRLKTGKEAEVWLVRHGDEVLAAKIYKDRHVRSFKNNAGYKEGRQVRNTRTARAIARGSKFGQKSEEDAWKSAEADALYKLRAQGVRVPEPKAFYDGVLLMQLVVDAEGQPAPRLIDAHLTPEEAAAAYADLRAQAVAMLCAELIHGDLSPYNVLLGAAGPTIIDFPQVVGAAHNNLAESFFRRDLENLRTHFAAIDPSLSARASDAAEIWAAYVRRELTPDFVPTGRAPPAPQREQRERGHAQRRPGGPQPAQAQGRAPPQHGQGRQQQPAQRQGRPQAQHGQGRPQPQHGQGQPRGDGQRARERGPQQDPRFAQGQRSAPGLAPNPPRHARHGGGRGQQRRNQGRPAQHPAGGPPPPRRPPPQGGRGPFPPRPGARPAPREGQPGPIVERVQRPTPPAAPRQPEARANEGEARAQSRPAEDAPAGPRREE